jgi:Zn-dependent protease with chaperone function
MSKFFMRVLGVVNLLLVILGIWYSVGMRSARIRDGKWPPYPPARLDWLLYFAFLALSVALVAWLSYLSVRLIRADRRALLPTCVVFGIEIAYETSEVWYFWLSAPRWVTDRVVVLDGGHGPARAAACIPLCISGFPCHPGAPLGDSAPDATIANATPVFIAHCAGQLASF